MANITSAGSGNSNAGSTWTGGSVPTSSDNAIIQDGHTVTQNAAHTFKSLRVETGGTWTADGSNHLTLSGENDSDFALQIVDGTYNHANGTVVINNGGGGIDHAAIQGGVANSTTGLYDLTISGGGTTCEIYGTTTIHRNMEAGGATTVLRGNLTVNGDLAVNATLTTIFSSTSYNLTVAGNTVVDGTLTGNNSTFSFGTNGVHGSTEGGCLLVNSSGTFTFGSGDVTIFSGFTAKGTEGSPNVTSTGGGDILIKGRTNNGFMNSHNHNGTNITGDYIIDYDNSSLFDNRGGVTIDCGNFIIKHDGRTYEPWNNAAQATFKIIGNMDIQDGTFDTEYSGQDSQHLTVTGDVTVTGTLTGNASAISMGGIKLPSGGTYNATSGTTTITNRYTGESHLWKNDGGTFNHNNGTVKFNDNDHSAVKENTFYSVEVESNLGDYAVSFEAQGGGGNAFTILGDLTITRGDFELVNADDTCDIHGQTIISGSSNSAARFNNDKNQTATITHHSLVTIITGTYHVEDGATVNMAGIRNIGGLVD